MILTDVPEYHYGITEPKPLRGFPEGVPLLFMSAVHFTRVQIQLPFPPEPPARSWLARITRWAAPPVTDPPAREFFVRVSDDGGFWEPGEEIIASPVYPPPSETTPTN